MAEVMRFKNYEDKLLHTNVKAKSSFIYLWNIINDEYSGVVPTKLNYNH